MSATAALSSTMGSSLVGSVVIVGASGVEVTFGVEVSTTGAAVSSTATAAGSSTAGGGVATFSSVEMSMASCIESDRERSRALRGEKGVIVGEEGENWRGEGRDQLVGGLSRKRGSSEVGGWKFLARGFWSICARLER